MRSETKTETRTTVRKSKQDLSSEVGRVGLSILFTTDRRIDYINLVTVG